MIPKITVLSDDVANHIAAGEVIERPASVVKELVENAIDAGATQIDVEIGVGGKAYIRIKDNGHGMSREDAQLAFERHATSKISCTEDIATIATLGFRGEALPSIASVSKLTLVTQTEDSIVGTRIEIHGGEVLHVMDSGASGGTFIEIRDLFYKTPARLKFLKSPATELSYINNVMTDQALANPHIGFTVKNNAKEQLHLPSGSDLRQRIAGLFGRDMVRELVEIRESAGSLELRGFTGLPSCNRANRNFQRMFVNSRAVKDKVIGHSIQQAYDTLLPKRRYPVVFLFLTLPVQLVDVNVHPTKAEVRFVNSQTIHQCVVHGIRDTLSAALHTLPTPSFSGPPATEAEPKFSPLDGGSISVPEPLSQSGHHAPELQNAQRQYALLPEKRAEESHEFLGSLPEDDSSHTPRTKIPELSSLFSQGGLVSSLAGGKAIFSRLKPIGQFLDTYILAQEGDNLFILDQHAAHERIFYEKLKAQFRSTEMEIQQLLFPVSLELSHREQAILEEHRSLLKQYGFDIEPFGGTTYLLKAVPALLLKADYQKLLYDILDRLTESGKTEDIEHTLDEVLMLMACHTAIRAHHHLQDAQIVALFRQLDVLELPYTCPHGRPTILKITRQDLEKKFHRV